MSDASLSRAAFPNLRRVGIRNFTFEACSGFTYVTACRIAQPPSAAFVARLQPARLPRQAACQLPDQTDYYLGGTFLHWCSAPSGRTEISGLGPRRSGKAAQLSSKEQFRHAKSSMRTCFLSMTSNGDFSTANPK
jgi:hypothetical protein